MTARNLGWDDRGLLLKHLEPNQEAFTKSALEEVREHRTEIMGTLHLACASRSAPIRSAERF